MSVLRHECAERGHAHGSSCRSRETVRAAVRLRIQARPQMYLDLLLSASSIGDIGRAAVGLCLTLLRLWSFHHLLTVLGTPGSLCWLVKRGSYASDGMREQWHNEGSAKRVDHSVASKFCALTLPGPLLVQAKRRNPAYAQSYVWNVGSAEQVWRRAACGLPVPDPFLVVRRFQRTTSPTSSNCSSSNCSHSYHTKPSDLSEKNSVPHVPRNGACSQKSHLDGDPGGGIATGSLESAIFQHPPAGPA